MKKGKDPATLFEQICRIENKYNAAVRKIDEDDLIAVVLHAAPAEYEAVLACEQRQLGTAMKIDDLEAAMNQLWRQIESNDHKSGGKDSDDAEFVLKIALEGYCFICKKKGHKADKCTDKTAKCVEVV